MKEPLPGSSILLAYASSAESNSGFTTSPESIYLLDHHSHLDEGLKFSYLRPNNWKQKWNRLFWASSSWKSAVWASKLLLTALLGFSSLGLKYWCGRHHASTSMVAKTVVTHLPLPALIQYLSIPALVTRMWHSSKRLHLLTGFFCFQWLFLSSVTQKMKDSQSKVGYNWFQVVGTPLN